MLTISDFCCEAERIKQMNVGSKIKAIEASKLVARFRVFIFNDLKVGLITKEEFDFIYSYSTKGLDWDNFYDKFSAFTDYLDFYLECKYFLDKRNQIKYNV